MTLAKILAVALVSFILVPSNASAALLISEVMYDVPSDVGADKTREWVEIFNSGPDSIDISKWKIFDGSNHVLNPVGTNGTRGSLIIAPGSYAVLADDATTFITLFGSAGTVIDTTLDLNNTSDTVSIINDAVVTVDTITYTKDLGAAGDGKSLHRSSQNTLTAQVPSPFTGILSTVSGSSGGGTVVGTGTTSIPIGSTSTPVSVSTNNTEQIQYVGRSSSVPPTLQVYAGADRQDVAGAPVTLQGSVVGKESASILNAKMTWNFGDGSTGNGYSVQHTWKHPGKYIVTAHVSYVDWTLTDYVSVTITSPKIRISSTADGVSVSNISDLPLNMSGWFLQTKSSLFEMPDETWIAARGSIVFDETVTGFTPQSTVRALYPSMEVVAQLKADAPFSDEAASVAIASTVFKNVTNVSHSAPPFFKPDPLVLADPASYNPADYVPAREYTIEEEPSRIKSESEIPFYVWALWAVAALVWACAGGMWLGRSVHKTEKIQIIDDITAL
jgi:Lamin Tail Domain/PKD domain